MDYSERTLLSSFESSLNDFLMSYNIVRAVFFFRLYLRLFQENIFYLLTFSAVTHYLQFDEIQEQKKLFLIHLAVFMYDIYSLYNYYEEINTTNITLISFYK